MLNLPEDQIIRAPFLPGPARVKKFEACDGYFQLEVVLEGTGAFVSRILTPQQVEEIEHATPPTASLNADPEEFFLFIEAAHRARGIRSMNCPV